MGAAGSVAAAKGHGTAKRIKNLHSTLPRLKRAGSDDNAKFLGVALQYGKKDAGVVPSGLTKCSCEGDEVDLQAVDESTDLYCNEYIEEEVKRVTNYVHNKARSGVTARGAKYCGPWFHADSASEAPKAVRNWKPFHEDGEWTEPWHVTRWIKFEDPYTHQRMRFRVWRRIERTALKKPPGKSNQEADEGAEAEAEAEAEVPVAEAFAPSEANALKATDSDGLVAPEAPTGAEVQGAIEE